MLIRRDGGIEGKIGTWSFIFWGMTLKQVKEHINATT